MASKRPRIMVTEAEYQAICEAWALYEMDDESQAGDRYRANLECLQRFQDRWLEAAARP